MIVVFDIDGTLADITHRLHFIKENPDKPDWDGFFDAMGDDMPYPEMADLCRVLASTHEIVFVTGRPEKCRWQTREWLSRNVSSIAGDCSLWMRPDHDHRSDHLIKRKILGQLIRSDQRPDLAIDDRQQVVDMWRSNGIRCLQCAKGDY